jgi:uncharacterized DUF497 family protein
MQFEWDEEKSIINKRKHRISFELAQLVFYDINRIETYDGRKQPDEDRWATIGVAEFNTLYVVYTVRGYDDTLRIISARKANAKEERAYRQAQF